MANVLQQRARSRSSPSCPIFETRSAAAALDAIDTAYGHSRIPVGAVADSSADTAPHGYSDVLAEQLPHAIRNSSQAQPAVHLYRRLLAAQPDHSVTVVAIGGDTNLAGLLRSGPGQGSSLPGRALVATKVKKLVIEDGLFPTGDRRSPTNVSTSPPPNGSWAPRAGRRRSPGSTGSQASTRRSVAGSVPLCRRRTRCASSTQKLFIAGRRETVTGTGPPCCTRSRVPGIFSELGQGGAAVINSPGWIVLGVGLDHPPEVYVHVVDQTELNARINSLIESS